MSLNIPDEIKQRIENNRLKAIHLRESRAKQLNIYTTDDHGKATISNTKNNTCTGNTLTSSLSIHNDTSVYMSSKSSLASNTTSICSAHSSPKDFIKDKIEFNRQSAIKKLNANHHVDYQRNKHLYRPNNTLFTKTKVQESLKFYGSCLKSKKNANHITYNKSKASNSPKTVSVNGKCILISRDKFEVCTQYNSTLIEIFKQINSRQYDPITRNWSFLLEDYHKLMDFIQPLKPNITIEPLPQAVLKSFSDQLKGVYKPNKVSNADLLKVDETLVQSLLPYQREGVNFGISKCGRLLLADDMGLGKTIQSICLAQYYHDDWPLLVVTPSSVRFDFSQQFQRWLPSLNKDDVNVITKVSDACDWGHVIIISYDIMGRKVEELVKKSFRIVIMDECHMLKNIKTSRTKAALKILKNARRVILMSGTPALSRPSELYTQIAAIKPNLFSYHEFGLRYCDGKQQPWGWDFSGSSNLVELQLLLEETLMLRRVKKDVLQQLPQKRRQVIQLDPSSISINKDLKSSSKLINSRNLKGMERRGVLLEYFHHTGQAKLAAIRSYVQDVVESGRKFLVFAHHREVLDSLENLIKSLLDDRYIRIDGQTPSDQRKTLMDEFQSNVSIQVALLSIGACNAGLNLSSASLVVFAELFWNPGILVQAEDRVHRIGQQDSVSVQYLVAPGTADDYIWPLIQSKLDVLGKVGLSKDNFSDSLSTTLKSKENTIEKYFEESFIEDCMEDTIQDDAESSFKHHRRGAELSDMLKDINDMGDLLWSNADFNEDEPTVKKKRL